MEIDVKGGEREHQSLSFEERERERAPKLITFLRERERYHLLKGERDLLGERPSKGRERSPGGENT